MVIGLVERVALLTWDFPPMPSGLGRAAFEIAKALVAQGVEVDVFDASKRLGETARVDGIDTFGAKTPHDGWRGRARRLGAVGHHVAPDTFRCAVLARHSQRRYDLVEATNWYAPAFALARTGLPLVVRNSTPAIDAWDSSAGWRDKLDLAHAHRLERLTAHRARALISNTESHKSLIEEIYRIRPAADHTVIALALDPQTLRRGAAATLPSVGGEQRLLFIGRAERRKGFEEALRGFARAARRFEDLGRPAIHLDVVGVDVEAVQALAAIDPILAAYQPRIAVAGRVEDDELHGLYENATAVLAPSRYESYGLVYREAAAFGRPLIACAQDPAAREFLAAARCGALAQECSAEAIADCIGRVLANSDDRQRFHENGKRHAETLSRAELGRRTLEVYRRAAALSHR